MHYVKDLTPSLRSAHIATGVHPPATHLQTYSSTLNQTHNLQIHTWLAFTFFFLSTTQKKSYLRSQTEDMVLVQNLRTMINWNHCWQDK